MHQPDPASPRLDGSETPPNPPGSQLPPDSTSAQAPTGPRVLCPYCGHVQSVTARCAACKGLLDPESRQATQNAMGPWQVRNGTTPFHPGCSYQTLREMVRRGKVTRETILRGPTTGQFWSMAANTPGVAVLLGECHACHQTAREDEYLCRHCGVILSPRTDRQHLGLQPVKPVGVPISQPPVVSAAPQSAFAAPSPGSAASSAESGPVPDPTLSPAFAMPASAPEIFPIDTLLARRRRDHRRRNAALLIGSASLGVIALVAALAVVMSRGKPAAQAPAAASPGVSPAGSNQAASAPIDPRVRFAAPLAEARRLTAIGDSASLEQALAALEQVRADAADPAASGPAGASITKFRADLDTIIEGVKAKLDDARLSEALAETEKK